jgi:hypothetical protein
MPVPTSHGRTIADSPIPQLLAARAAIVLERIARGGGATQWYRCLDQTDLDAITSRLSPGSVVSFYFDDRIACRRYTAELHQQMLELMNTLRGLPGETGEIVVGRLAADELHIEVDLPDGPESLDDLIALLGSHSSLYYGRYPGRDNDGIHAVTLTLPDHDGILRAHPH